MGSKARHAKEILNAISEEVSDKKYDNWVEPFVGGANMIDKVQGYRKWGNDVNQYLIEMFWAVQRGWLPPSHVTEAYYKDMLELSKSKQESKTVKSTIGFVGIGCSYSGKWFGGYARGNDSKGNSRNYCLESRKNLLAQNITGIAFTFGSYDEMDIPPNSLIYCDPPYAGATKYKDKFDHEKFWFWCDEQISKGHKVFVSEYNAPEDWQCIWLKEVNNTLTKDTGSKKGIEKLFTK
jgi:DNA adenine methylase